MLLQSQKHPTVYATLTTQRQRYTPHMDERQTIRAELRSIKLRIRSIEAFLFLVTIGAVAWYFLLR